MASRTATRSPLRAGVARVDITGGVDDQLDDPLYATVDAAKGVDRLYVRALVLQDDLLTVVLVAVDAVAIAEIGSIDNDFLANVREQLQQDPGIDADHVIINASHCHGVVCADVEQRTVQAVRQAAQNLVAVTVGVGRGHEDRIMENRRLQLRNGREADVRRAYSLPADDEVESVGPVDPEIGILRLDRAPGTTLALVYNFACHPIQGTPDGGNTADLSGFASRVIEQGFGGGAVALFMQGCAADINPIRYRDIDTPPDAEPLGQMLGLSTLRAAQEIRCGAAASLQVTRESVALPKADLQPSIKSLEAEQSRLLRSLQATSLNLKTFIPLLIKHSLSPEFPSYDAHLYLHEARLGREHLRHLDENNRRLLDQYTNNIYTMEQLTRVGINLGLLRMHQARNVAAAGDSVEAEVTGLRIGPLALVTFSGELPVEIGLRLKRLSPHDVTFVAGVTNGYMYYTATADQLRNRGGAQEDSDCFVAPEWQQLFEDKALQILNTL
jgi:hypothetical protein